MEELAGRPDAPSLPGISDLVPIGRGGSATVYRGWQPALHRRVAVKVLDTTPGTPSPSHFEKELRALGSLSGHPHVVPVYDAGETGGRPYLVMPYLSGGSLDDRIRQGPLPADAAVRLGCAVADAVSAAHRVGVLHRDIKPANILATAFGEPQLADFGIAHFVDSTATHGQLNATVAYAAPEVLAGEASTPASDIYSLGATLYAALRGAPAFCSHPDESVIAFAVRVINEQPPSLRDHGVAPGLAAVVERAMAKDPTARYPSAAALADDLRGADLRPPRMPAPPAGRGSPTPNRPPPHRFALSRSGVLAGAAAVAFLAVVGTGLGLALTGSGSHAPRRSAGAAPPAARSVPPSTSPTASTTTPGQSRSVPVTSQPSTVSSPTPAELVSTVDRYYAMVDRHQLSQAFQWLTPAFQQRIGYAYYQQFWDSVSRVDVLQVAPGAGQVTVTLHYVKVDGTTTTEPTRLSITPAPGSGKLLIDQYGVG
ncbi:serine/threonine protein kinase [Acidiferrimicrobium sp. IK]|uniref:serine/threonine-protein kinase n=1 Tax=Acidiferrimicrobium sp. IK TaxID=2871700 RepID=UPI0021CB0EC8|nr:serine/threonine-protein kinase [Acidiferrimicrobium sp. IK]MCU4182821.1 serine/threonine protein kinase [Acidiferrimicrobium sp. IK]